MNRKIKKPGKLLRIAQVCHEANRAFCETHGDVSQKSWEEAEPWQRDAALEGVKFRLKNPKAKISAQHDYWMAHKVADGWKYGKVKDEKKKTHPSIVPYEKLPLFEKQKDALFVAVIEALR